jgi:primosomal protein N' (replication factor Y) (superfamily II helicase)
VQVPFHGRSVRGWILGPADEVPDRILPVTRVVSAVRMFDPELLSVARWVSERYVAPLAAVLGRLTPPRVAGEEDGAHAPDRRPVQGPATHAAGILETYRGGGDLLEALRGARGSQPPAFVLRPAPEHEQRVAVEAVVACLGAGRRALVLVPEADPVPATAVAIAEAVGSTCVLFLGGSKRDRYRTWLRIRDGAHDVVVATRPGVFAPLVGLGLIYVSRESHPAHREDRSPYYHVRDVALARARVTGAVCVQAALCPSSEAAASDAMQVRPDGRWWPPVEVVRPGPEGRAPGLIRALKTTRKAFVLSPLPGAGVAAVCRSCGSPAACGVCGGLLRLEEGIVRCAVCEAPGRCAVCSGTTFGVRRGGAERVEAWASRVAAVPVRRLRRGDTARLPDDGEVLVGGPEDVHDLGTGGCDLVAVLDADLAARRPGLSALERSVSTWFEAVAWARPEGRAIVQATRPGDAPVQALVRGNPDRFHRQERDRRAAAGFPVGAAVFRVAGSGDLEPQLAALEPITLLVTGSGSATVCLLALEPGRVPAFGRRVRELAAEGIVTRVEAEPHL